MKELQLGIAVAILVLLVFKYVFGWYAKRWLRNFQHELRLQCETHEEKMRKLGGAP